MENLKDFLGKENLKGLVKDYEVKEEAIIVSQEDISANKVENNAKVSDLVIGEVYYTEDFDGHFCSYYLVKRLEEETVLMIPLWEKEDGLFHSNESDNEIMYGFVLQLNEVIENEIFEHEIMQKDFGYLKRQDNQEEFKLHHYWSLSDNANNDLEKELSEQIFYFFHK